MINTLKNLSPNIKKSVAGLVTAAMVSVTAFLMSSADIGAPMTAEFEGAVLKNYLDTGGVETWCIGETQVGRLEVGYTKEYCKNLFMLRYPQYSAKVYACYDDKAKQFVTPSMHAAFTDVFYNAGAGCRSGMIRHLKTGNPMDACVNMLAWKNSNGKDCSIAANGCMGVWNRRLKLYALCFKDAQKLSVEGLVQ